MKKHIVWLLLLLFPINVFAYSNKLIISGEPIGIEIHSQGVYIVDFYKVDNQYIGKEAGFLKGDRIVEINSTEVKSIKEMNKIINKPGTYEAKIKRGEETVSKTITAKKENNKIQTGLYVKDEINGIGTLSYIDPETKIYASLGHEILETSSMSLFEINHGYIYDVEINYINKSENGNIGEVHANFNSNILGSIEKNEINGIYGKYQEDIPNVDVVEVATKTEIRQGKASVRLEIDEQGMKDYEIDILTINEQDPVKNIFFEITDEELLEKTGGVVQGMSGSPIIQDEKIIGVVNYVVINDSKKGYGIFIEKMLEEGDKLLQE